VLARAHVRGDDPVRHRDFAACGAGSFAQRPLARFTEKISWCTGWTSWGSSPKTWTGGPVPPALRSRPAARRCSPKSDLIVQKDEYSYAHYPASFFESFYYRKNFDLPGYRWRLLDGDTELLPG